MKQHGPNKYSPRRYHNCDNSSFVGGDYHTQSQRVLKDSDINKAQNTECAYDPKVLEFLQFCTSLYGNIPSSRIVDEEKSFAFLFYQAYREKNLGKKNSKLSFTDNSTIKFDREDYDNVISKTKENCW